MQIKHVKYFLILLIIFNVITGCSNTKNESNNEQNNSGNLTQNSNQNSDKNSLENEHDFGKNLEGEKGTFDSENSVKNFFDISMVDEYAGTPFFEINNNIPFFTNEEITDESFEKYGELDQLGRCTFSFASIAKDLMSSDERGSIGMIKPTGWHTVRYDDLIEDKYLYNRCHLIGFQLTGENANEKNLITGTRYMNVEGMLPFENLVADYIRKTDNHVMYRVTPIFKNENLVATGVLMEGWSVEDEGEGICFCVFVYNVQPGIEINYSNGESKRVGQGGCIFLISN